MGNVVVALSGAVGALAVAGGLAALAAGLLALASSWGTSGLGALYLLSLGVLLGGGGGAVLVSGLVLRRAFHTLSALGPDLPTPTLRVLRSVRGLQPR